LSEATPVFFLLVRLGGLGDMKCKKFLNQMLDQMLDPIRQRRHEFEQDIPKSVPLRTLFIDYVFYII